TYYSSFLHYADERNILRPSLNQGGTTTGRFSSNNPNMQNCPKEDEEGDKEKPFLIRSCFIPRPDHYYVPIDFDQQEYRLMLDYAGERQLIDMVLSGMDVHNATAEMLGSTRKRAKTLNFAIIY